ncbi:MAG: metal ABC transporter substrate-binding protein [Turneriella sp.]
MKKISGLFVVLLATTVWTTQTSALQIVTTTTDLASIAKEIGGDLVNVESLTEGNIDLHFVSARPDFIMKVNRADVFVEVGLDLEAAWTPLLLNQARNTKVQRGQQGYCFAWKGIKLLQVPTGTVDRSMGDIHVFGNPHYWIDPLNGIQIAKNILNTLAIVDYAHEKQYRANYDQFVAKVKKLSLDLMKVMRPHKGKKIVVYHQEFNYLADRFGLEIAGSVEQRMGIAPAPAWINKTVTLIKEQKIPVVLVSPWSNVGIARRVAEESGARLLILPVQTGSGEKTETWLKMIETATRTLAGAL